MWSAVVAGLILSQGVSIRVLNPQIGSELRRATAVRVYELRPDLHRVGMWPELWGRPGELLQYRVKRTMVASESLEMAVLEALSTRSDEPAAWPILPGVRIEPPEARDFALRFTRRFGRPFWVHIRLPSFSATVYLDGFPVQKFHFWPRSEWVRRVVAEIAPEQNEAYEDWWRQRELAFVRYRAWDDTMSARMARGKKARVPLGNWRSTARDSARLEMRHRAMAHPRRVWGREPTLPAGADPLTAVRVRATIDTAGNVISVAIVDEPTRLDAAVLAAVRTWKYIPARTPSGPFETTVEFPVGFRR